MTQTGTPTGWQDYTELEKLTRALADKVRLNIVRILANSQQEVNVTDLTQHLLISQPLVSWHLAILRRNGLVRTRRQGRQVYCSLDVARCQQSLRQLEDVVSGLPAPAPTATALTPTAAVATSSVGDSAPAVGTQSASGASGASGDAETEAAPSAASGAASGKQPGVRPARQF
jgi:ArsR family transcriptional regulator, arsenate/arsenite/antimonite-responsive transcriptional repressor